MTDRERRVERHPSIQIEKKWADKAIRYLAEQHIIHRALGIEPTENFILIPLNRRLSKQESSTLDEKFGPINLADHNFPLRPRSHRNLRDAVQGKIPDKLLKSLPSSYDIIGDIAVLDLPPGMSQYETVLAEGIRLVNKNVAVVLAKTGAVTGHQRILPTRHISGENRTITIHRESSCFFKVDISKAFFSPRLSHEHERIANQVEEGESVTDLFTGVGPFSIMIAKRLAKVEVNAVDSNPDAIQLLKENLSLNKIKGNLHVWTGDARQIVENELTHIASRVIMNNPSASHSYIDVACEALGPAGGIIHYYTFSQGQDCEAKAVAELETGLRMAGWRAKWLGQTRRVREVAPMKWQVAVDAPIVPIT